MPEPGQVERHKMRVFGEPRPYRFEGEQVFAEYVAHSTAAATGRLAHHLFMGRLVAENGQITLLREGLNTVAAASALLAGGAHDLPEPTNEVHAF